MSSATAVKAQLDALTDPYLAVGMSSHAIAGIAAVALAELERLTAELKDVKRDAALAEKHWHRDQADLNFIVAERDRWIARAEVAEAQVAAVTKIVELYSDSTVSFQVSNIIGVIAERGTGPRAELPHD